MSEFDKMHTGELYLPSDDEIAAAQQKCLDRLYDYNMTRPSEPEKRKELLSEMFAEIGEGAILSLRFMRIGADATSTSVRMSTATSVRHLLMTHTSTSEITRCSVSTSRSQRQVIRSCPSCVKKPISTICRCISDATAGSARE